MLFEKSAFIDVMGKEVEVKLNFADGMIGCIPVFEKEEDAVKYANGKAQVYKLTGVTNGSN